jgi:hypothetical protein
MVHTKKCSEKAEKLCGKVDQVLDEDQERLNRRRLMVNKLRDILAPAICDELDQDINEEEKRLNKRRQLVKKQRDISEGITRYMIKCGAIEEKVTRRWENS